MQATLLGTGCPIVHPQRGGAATLIQHGNASLMIDCGSMATQRLVEAGTNGAALDALLLTHLHSDHLVDLYQLIVSSWHQGRARPWPVYAPAPVLRHVEGLMALWAEERAQRIAFEERGSTAGFEIEPREVGGGDHFSVSGIEVETVEVAHAPVEPALGFVFWADGKSIVHSGDTARCAALIEAGRGADLLIHEVYLHRQDDGAKMRKTASYHTLSSEVGGVARDMGARALALTHFVPPEFDRAALLAEVAENYDGPVFIGEDGMRFDLDTGDVAWREMHARLLPPSVSP